MFLLLTLTRQMFVGYIQLTHIEPMFPFGTPWKHQKTLRFSDILRRSQKGTKAQHRLNING